MTRKFEYLMHPGQTADCAYKLDEFMFPAYHSSLVYKYYCVSSFLRICQISLFYISLLYKVISCVKQTDKIEVVRSTVRLTFKTTKPRTRGQGTLKTIDIERSMEGCCRTSLFLFSNKQLIGQGLVYFPLFEGVFVTLKRAVCLIALKAISMGSHEN